MRRRLFLSSLSLAAAGAPLLPAYANADSTLLAQLRRGGHIILMRHAATTPGIGDPDGFVLNQCATQRNLSEAGRRDAARIGALFVRHAIPVDDVLSSRWCRCLDTAQLAFGRVTPAPMLDSMFTDDAATKARKLEQLRATLAATRNTGNPGNPGNLVLVTHDVNIRALAGPYVEQGAMVVATVADAGALRVAGVWRP